ncbi:MAG TPA: DUF1048 domain-containing protein [Nonomuraea sp.]|nr:DUF1048 domain-containing protein [Nonomuraea sp.]
MLKGTLEGIVLAILSGRPAYGYEITAWLRDQGFSDIAEGTIYALLVRIEQSGLVDVEKVPSDKGPRAGVLPQRTRTRASRRVLGDLELPHRTPRTAPQRRQADMTTESDKPKSRYLQYLELVTGSLEEKKRWRQYKARIKQLPENFRTAVEALERYLMHFGPADGADTMSMYEDLADLFEQSAADGSPIRDIFGQDPVEFVEAFLANYPQGQWISRERKRLADAIERAVGDDTGKEVRTV